MQQQVELVMRLNHSGEAYFPEQWELDASATKSPVKLRGAPLAQLPKSPAKAGDESAGGSSDEEDGGTAKDAMTSPTRGGGRGIFHGWRGRFGWRRNHANDGTAEQSVESAADDGDEQQKALPANGNGQRQGDGGEGSSAPIEAEAQARLSLEALPLTDTEAASSHTNGVCTPVQQLFPPLEHEARAAAAAAVAESMGNAGRDDKRTGSGAIGDERVSDSVKTTPSHGLDLSHAEQDAVEMTAAAAAAAESTTAKPSPPRQNGRLEVHVWCRALSRFRRRRLQLLLTFPTWRWGHSGWCSP
jgi:hypothetical protein